MTEEQARALLAAEYEAAKYPLTAKAIRSRGADNIHEEAALRALTKALSREPVHSLHELAREDQARAEEGWHPMSEAPRDGSYILAIVAPNRGRHLEHQAGRMFAIRHEGLSEPSGYDMGWAVYPGFGGATDHDFACWTRLPAPPGGGSGGD